MAPRRGATKGGGLGTLPGRLDGSDPPTPLSSRPKGGEGVVILALRRCKTMGIRSAWGRPRQRQRMRPLPWQTVRRRPSVGHRLRRRPCVGDRASETVRRRTAVSRCARKIYGGSPAAEVPRPSRGALGKSTAEVLRRFRGGPRHQRPARKIHGGSPRRSENRWENREKVREGGEGQSPKNTNT